MKFQLSTSYPQGFFSRAHHPPQSPFKLQAALSDQRLRMQEYGYSNLAGLQWGLCTMTENSGISMRVIALDEMMKVISEVGRSIDDPQQKALLKALFTAAKERQDFLKLNTREDE